MNALDGFLNEKQPYEVKSYLEILKLAAQILRKLQSNPKKFPIELTDEASIENAVQHIKSMYLLINDLIIRLDSSHPDGPALLYDKLVAKSKDAIAYLQSFIKIAIISSASYHLGCHKDGNKAQLTAFDENINMEFVTSNHIADLFNIEDS